jgi:hypothetical protein
VRPKAPRLRGDGERRATGSTARGQAQHKSKDGQGSGPGGQNRLTRTWRSPPWEGRHQRFCGYEDEATCRQAAHRERQGGPLNRDRAPNSDRCRDQDQRQGAENLERGQRTGAQATETGSGRRTVGGLRPDRGSERGRAASNFHGLFLLALEAWHVQHNWNNRRESQQHLRLAPA